MPVAFHTLVDDLWCLHWPQARLAAPEVAVLQSSGVFLATCLRQLAFGLAPRPRVAGAVDGELHTGAAAYRLLLEVASGLRSAVPGETNVAGQFRHATESAAATLAPDYWRQLQPVIQSLQADTRRLRASHLQGLAGTSYGSLVRALLAPSKDARVLFIGTGELARSVLPLFSAVEVAVWNHRLVTRHSASLTGVGRWFAPDQADAAAAWCTDVVFTTPRDAAHDTAWCLRLARHAQRRLVHLGQRRDDDLAWSSAAASFHLDDVFDLASARDQRRGAQLASALRACEDLVASRLASRELPPMAPHLAPATA